nr:hypothetical protein [Microbispora sp. CL1-1]
MFGHVPDAVRDRWTFSAEHGRFTAPGLLEELRREVITRSPLGLKVQQLVQFAQLVALARALVRTPDLLLLDEPFAALDALTRLKMQRQVAGLWRRHEITTLMVTHDVEEALLLADRVLLVDGGRIADEIRVGLPRPRDPRDPEFAALRYRLLLSLGVDLSGGTGAEPRPGAEPDNAPTLAAVTGRPDHADTRA